MPAAGDIIEVVSLVSGRCRHDDDRDDHRGGRAREGGGRTARGPGAGTVSGGGGDRGPRGGPGPRSAHVLGPRRGPLARGLHGPARGDLWRRRPLTPCSWIPISWSLP